MGTEIARSPIDRGDIAAERRRAIGLIVNALEILDRVHPTAAATLSMALNQLGERAPPLPSDD
ncbi:hypothetical protein ACFSCW_14345 [Sphingomonas tabacisoli]|uniref:Uncharacterized protein n=1 Tax=Sphingomonas tabacisoli TaxID=2249466 RepID=A0ABW4I6U9_9SPHN